MSGFMLFRNVAIYAQAAPEIRGYVAGIGNVQLSICPENVSGHAVSLFNVGFHTRTVKPGMGFFGLWFTFIGITLNAFFYSKPVIPKVRS